MKFRLHACLWLGLALSGCDKPQETGRPAAESASARRATRTERSLLNNAPDSRKKLRAELVAAAELESPAEREMAMAKVAWDALELDPELAR